MTESTTEAMMTTNQVAKRFHKSIATIRRWREKKILTGYKVGGTWYFRTEDIEALTQDKEATQKGANNV